jgi:hypothetical protein
VSAKLWNTSVNGVLKRSFTWLTLVYSYHAVLPIEKRLGPSTMWLSSCTTSFDRAVEFPAWYVMHYVLGLVDSSSCCETNRVLSRLYAPCLGAWGSRRPGPEQSPGGGGFLKEVSGKWKV